MKFVLARTNRTVLDAARSSIDHPREDAAERITPRWIIRGLSVVHMQQRIRLIRGNLGIFAELSNHEETLKFMEPRVAHRAFSFPSPALSSG